MDEHRAALNQRHSDPGARGLDRDAPAGSAWLAILPIAFLGLFFLYPVIAVLWRGLGAESGPLLTIFTRSSTRSVIWFTIWQAVVSTALTLLVAMPLTAAMATFRFRGRRLVRALVTVPFVLPTVVVAAAFTAVLDRFGLDDGRFGLRHSVWIVLAAHVFFNVAVVVRTVGSFWSQLDDRQEQAARTLGATPWRAFREVTLARLRPALLAATSIVFLFTFTSFGLVLLLGGPRLATIETEIYRYAVSRTDFSTAAALAVLQLIAVGALVAVNTRLNRHHLGRERLAVDRTRAPRTTGERLWLVGSVVGTLGLLATPIVVLAERSFTSGGGYSWANYRALGTRVSLLPINAGEALRNSLVFALVAAALSVLIGGCAALAIVYGRRLMARALDLGLLLPLGTSAVTVGFGMLIALDEPPLDLRQSWIIIPIAQSLIGIPFVVRATVPVLTSIDDRLRDAAGSLGASPWRVRREVDLPLAARALAIGTGFAFAIALGEFGATSFVGRRPDLLTVPLAIARLLGQPGEALRGQAMALSMILMIVTTVIVFVVDRNDQAGVL